MKVNTSPSHTHAFTPRADHGSDPSFLEIRDLEVLNRALVFDTHDCQVLGRCELYTTKAAGHDKKLYKQLDSRLEHRYQEEMELSMSLSPETPRQQHSLPSSSFEHIIRSPFGPLDQPSSRKTFAYLVATLNASHPDYDFSSLRPFDFKKERKVEHVMSNVDVLLGNVGKAEVTGAMWECIDKHIELEGCDVYSFRPDADSDPFGEEALIWSRSYFFFNKGLKRVLYLNLRSVSRASPLLAPDDGPAAWDSKGYYEDDLIEDMEL
ncbi:RNA polymerase III-inhibiting protein maf1 [Saitoella coloradoensis]